MVSTFACRTWPTRQSFSTSMASRSARRRCSHPAVEREGEDGEAGEAGGELGCELHACRFYLIAQAGPTPDCAVARAALTPGAGPRISPRALRPRLPLPLGSRVVPDLRGVPRPPRRRRRPRARSARGRSGIPLPARRPDGAARGLPGGPARAARRARARRARRPARHRPVVRAARLAAAVGRGARAQPAARPRRPRRRSARCRASPTCPTRSAIRRSSRSSSPASASTAFVYWRGNGRRDRPLGSAYRWDAPDGSAVAATLLREGYFNAACLPTDVEEAARRLAELAARLDDGAGRPSC